MTGCVPAAVFKWGVLRNSLVTEGAASVKRARLLVIASGLAALLVGGAASPVDASPRDVAVGPGEAEVTVKVQYRAAPSSTPVKLSTNTEVSVVFWKLDPVAGYWYEQAQGTWTDGPGQVDTSDPLPACLVPVAEDGIMASRANGLILLEESASP